MRIGTTDDLGRFVGQFFKFNLPVALILMVAGLIIDWFVGHQMFQRFGALLVGLGVLHYFAAREIEAQISKYEMLQQSFKGRISRFLPCPVDPNDQKYKSSLNVIASVLNAQAGQLSLAPAEVILNELLLAESEVPRLKLQLKDVRNFEVLMVIIGTIVWAFGDLLTNFFFHCGLSWSC